MRVNHKVFLPSLLVILAVLALVGINLGAVQATVDVAYNFLIDKLGWFYILASLVALIFSLFIMFGPYRNIRLGGPDAKPAFSTFSWAAMMFTTSCGAWLIVYGFLEPIYCAAQPPFQLEPLSVEAMEYGMMYAHYHWGPGAWCIYVPASVAIGYILYNRGGKRGTVSEACKPILGNRMNGIWGNIIDIFSVFGAVISPVISIGTGMPLLTVLLQAIFGIPDQYTQLLQLCILFVWIAIFGTSVYLGLQKGIKKLSDANVFGAFTFMVVVGLLVGIFKVFSAEINTLGLLFSEYPRLATYTDPYGTGSFVKGWTSSYWAVYFVYMPLMGVFNAKISKGRTLKEMAFGQLVLCSLGCWVSMATFGGYAMNLQNSGKLNVAEVLSTKGEASAILAILEQMPFPKVMMVILLIVCFIFLATTMDSSAFAAAEMTINRKDNEQLAPRWMRIVWAVVACVIAFVLLQVGDFKAVRAMSIITGLPLAILSFVIIAVVLKILKQDAKKDNK